jgi:hypothetical protein
MFNSHGVVESNSLIIRDLPARSRAESPKLQIHTRAGLIQADIYSAALHQITASTERAGGRAATRDSESERDASAGASLSCTRGGLLIRTYS